MDWRFFIQQADSWKIFLFDIEPAAEVETLVWAQNYSVGADVLVNGSVEAWDDAHTPTGWTTSPSGGSTTNRESSNPHSGSYCIRQDIDSSGNSAPDKQTFSLTPGARYRLTLWYKGTAPSGYVTVWLHSVGESVYLANDGSWRSVNGGVGIVLPNASSWTEFTVDFDAHISHTNYYLQLQNDAGCESSSIYWDDISIKPLTAGNCWYASFPDGVPNRIEEDGSAYLETFSVAECDLFSSSFYYDYDNQVLYLHTSGSDSPGKLSAGLPVYTILVFFWRHLSNAAFESDPVVLPRITEAIYNGDFETWYDITQPYDWYTVVDGASSVNVETSDVHSGAYCVRLDIDGSNSLAGVYKNPVRLAPGKTCKLKVWYKNSVAGKTMNISLVDVTTNVHLKSDGTWDAGNGSFDLPNATDWTEFTLEFVANASYVDYYLFLQSGDAASSSIYIDDVQIDVQREQNQYLPLASHTMPDLHQSIQLFHLGTVTMEAGTVEFINDGWWYGQFKKYWWHTKNVIVRMGDRGADYEDFDQVFSGVISDIHANELVAKVDIVDNKVLTYANVNPRLYDAITYPWLEDNADGMPIPIIYGEFDEVVPTCIDLSTYKFKVADHALEAISEIWKNGVLLTAGVDYTLDLANGEFTLLADPASTFITCHVKGKKCNRFCALSSGTYSENVADILYDMLIDYSGIDPEDIDIESLLDLKNSRSQKHQLYICQNTQMYNIIRILQASALFHFIPETNGKFGAYRFKAGTESDTIRINNEDIEQFGIEYDTEGVYKIIQLTYGYNPSTSHYEQLNIELAKTEWKHKRRDTLPVPTSLREAADVAELGAYYTAVLMDPIKMVVGTLPPALFSCRPGDKIIISKTKKLDDGTIYTVFSSEPYRLIDLRKKIQTGKVEIKAWDDLQSSGEQFCEVCYHCQLCDAVQGGYCSKCYACQVCVAGECSSCQACYYCQHCDSDQCSACEICNTCQHCNTCEHSYGTICLTCQKCYSGECSHCEHCDTCQRCVTCERVCDKVG